MYQKQNTLKSYSRMAKADAYVLPVPARVKGVKGIFLYFFRIEVIQF